MRTPRSSKSEFKNGIKSECKVSAGKAGNKEQLKLSWNNQTRLKAMLECQHN